MDIKQVKIDIPEKANFIIKTLSDAGFEAYVVGGCVRDSILGRNPRTGISPHPPRPLRLRSFSDGRLIPGSSTELLPLCSGRKDLR